MDIKNKIDFEEKGSRFTEDMLNNSEDLYTSASNFDDKHLQQFYTPTDFAQFLARCLPVNLGEKSGSGNLIIDPTSGNGNLLTPFLENNSNVCVGIEIDNNNIPSEHPGNLMFFNADFVKLSHYLKDLKLEHSILALNPPFSLKWNDGTGETESQEWMLDYALDNISILGCGYMICLKTFADKVFTANRFEEHRKYINARIDVHNLFVKSKAAIETSVLFFSKSQVECLKFDIDYLDNQSKASISAQIRFMLNDNYVAHYEGYKNEEEAEVIEGCYYEYKRSKQQNVFDIYMERSVLKLNLTNYKWYKIKNTAPDKYASLREVNLKTANYLAFNAKLRLDLFSLIDDGILTVEPEAKLKLERAIADSELVITPFKPMPPQQRLGYLTDHTKITCKKATPDGNFIAGKSYDITTSTKINEITYNKDVVIKGVEQIRNFSKQIKALQIIINTDETSITLTESTEDIKFLTEYFEMPNPMDVASKFPTLHKQMEARLRSEEFAAYTLKEYQIYDLSRAALKDALILSWDQGGGKSRGALAWSQLKHSKKCIIICPQDLLPQWKNEAVKFGLHLQEIRDGEDAIEAINSESGYWITYFEFLSLCDTVNETDDIYNVTICKTVEGITEKLYQYETTNTKIAHHINDNWKNYNAVIDKQTVRSKFFRGWSVLLKDAFDTVILDEAVKIKTKESLRGIAVRRFKAKNKLLLSGSPIKNTFVDLYYLFGWAFGYKSSRFPYEYGDKEKFQRDYGTYEKMETRWNEKSRPPKLIPEINQISLFWRLLSPGILRRKKADFGEDLVAKRIHRISCDFTHNQHNQYKWWDANFDSWFLRTHPDFDESKLFNSKILGLLWKYRITATAPHRASVNSTDTYFNPNPYTNKILACLEIVKECLLRDEQVIIFTGLKDNAQFLQRLFGTKAMVANGTLTPKKRTPIINSFKNGTFPILIAGIEALNLGHSFEQCNNLILCDFCYEHSTTRQAIDRIHRLNSLKDVNIYLLFVKGSYDEVMIEMVDKKGMSSDYALDGELMDQEEMSVDYRQLLKASVEAFHNLNQAEFTKEELVEDECRRVMAEINMSKAKQHDIISKMFKKPSGNSITVEVKTFKRKRIDNESDNLGLFS